MGQGLRQHQTRCVFLRASFDVFRRPVMDQSPVLLWIYPLLSFHPPSSPFSLLRRCPFPFHRCPALRKRKIHGPLLELNLLLSGTRASVASSLTLVQQDSATTSSSSTHTVLHLLFAYAILCFIIVAFASSPVHLSPLLTSPPQIGRAHV